MWIYKQYEVNNNLDDIDIDQRTNKKVVQYLRNTNPRSLVPFAS